MNIDLEKSGKFVVIGRKGKEEGEREREEKKKKRKGKEEGEREKERERRKRREKRKKTKTLETLLLSRGMDKGWTATRVIVHASKIFARDA